MIAAAAHNIFRDWTTYVTGIGVALSVYGGIYIKDIYPQQQAHKVHEAEREALRIENAKLEERNKCLPEEVELILWWIAVHEKNCNHGES